MCERVARECTRGWLPIGPREDDNQPWMLNSACLGRRMLALHACLARSALASLYAYRANACNPQLSVLTKQSLRDSNRTLRALTCF